VLPSLPAETNQLSSWPPSVAGYVSQLPPAAPSSPINPLLPPQRSTSLQCETDHLPPYEGRLPSYEATAVVHSVGGGYCEVHINCKSYFIVQVQIL